MPVAMANTFFSAPPISTPEKKGEDGKGEAYKTAAQGGERSLN